MKQAKDGYKIGKTGKDDYSLTINDHILDSIYGQIGLTRVERELEFLPIFKRLHNISQLGLVNWIFPCALHTRYTHSIGVMHVAGMMAEHINQNVKETFFTNDDIQLIRLAGLLHDIGHYPLSHNIEQAYKDVKARAALSTQEDRGLKYFINCPDYLNPQFKKEIRPKEISPEEWEKIHLGEKRDSYWKSYTGSEGMHHENIGALLIANNAKIRETVINYFLLVPSEDGALVLNPRFRPENKAEGEWVTRTEVEEIARNVMRMIGEIVKGNYRYESSTRWDEKYSAMIQLIHSELDADNLDYLLRDATFSGTSYGLMDMGMLLNSLTVATLRWDGVPDVEKRGEAPDKEHWPAEPSFRYLVGVRQKGLGCVEQFMMNRFLAYTQMILSKYVSILEAMLLRVESDYFIPTDDGKRYSWQKLLNEVSGRTTSEDYLRFSDYYIFSKITEKSEETGAYAILPRAIVSCLANFHAFDLANGDSQCMCTGLSHRDIETEIKKSAVYKDFCQKCKEIGTASAKKIGKDPELSRDLFAYRFESFAFTKQQKLGDFFSDYDLGAGLPDKRFAFHYCRLGNGVPVLEDEKEYKFDPYADDEKCAKDLPRLVVDCKESMLSRLDKMEYVSLRKYKVEEYKVS